MPQRLALLIGNSEYDDTSLSKLVAPSQDVTELGELLRSPEIGGFTSVETVLNQSYAAIRRAIARFFTGTTRDDLLLLYFSGHGILDDQGHLYLAVKDTEHDLLNATAIEASFISDVMDRSMSRTQILMLDCCHSGAFGRTKGALGSSVGTASLFEGKGFGRVVLTASDATQYAWDGDALVGGAANSVFTRYLVQGLRSGEADADADGLITLDELYDYVYENVISETPNQTPAKWSFRQQGSIILARNPSPVIKPAPLPEGLLQAVESPFAGIRQGAVQDLQRLLNGSDRSLAYSAELSLKELTQDDSRAVSTAAQAALASVQTTPAAQPAIPVPAPSQAQPASPATGVITSPPLVTQPKTLQGAFAKAVQNPFVIVAGGWGITWLVSLLLAQLTTNFFGFLIAWLVGGLVTGVFLFRDKRAARWQIAALMAACWGIPFFYLFILASVLDLLSIFPGLEIFIPTYIFLTFMLVGIGSSLAIMYHLRASRSENTD